MTSVKPQSEPFVTRIHVKTLKLQQNACIIASGPGRRKQYSLEDLSRNQPESAILNLDPSPSFNPHGSASVAAGRLLAIDLGARRVGLALSDELQITANPLPFVERGSWKTLLRHVASVIAAYDARGLVIGLPLHLDGTEGDAAREAKRIAENFRRSLDVPVYLQDERLTTFEAAWEMRRGGVDDHQMEKRIDSESAAIILRDFMAENAGSMPTAGAGGQ